eukprot:jgi/Psemu1/10996/gm1.10996_g
MPPDQKRLPVGEDSLGICALSSAQRATLCMGAISRSPGSTHKFCAAPLGTCTVVKHWTTKFNLEPSAASASGTYLFIKTKPGVLSATVCHPVEAVINEDTSLQQQFSQHHTFDQWEAVFRTFLTGLQDPTGYKALSPANVQDVLDTAKPLFEMKVKKLDLSSTSLQLAAIKLIIRQQNGNHTDTLMESNAKFTNVLGTLKDQPPALAKDKQDKVMQLFNYFSPDLSNKLSLRIHLEIMNSLGHILEFFKACSTQTAGDILLDRISRLESTTAEPSLHVPGLSGFTSLSLTPPAKSANMADLQAQLDALEAHFTSFREESNITKIHLVNTYFTSRMDMGAWGTLHANNSAGYLHGADSHSLRSHANALWLNRQFNIPGHVPTTDLPQEFDELHTAIKITGSQGKLSIGKKQKRTPNLHSGAVLLSWTTGSSHFSHVKLGGVMDGWFLSINFILPPAIQTTLHKILSSRARKNNFVAEPKPQQRSSSKGWLQWSRKRRRISLPYLNRHWMWIHNERILDALINHETPGKLLARAIVWLLGSDPTQPGSTPTGEEQQNSPLGVFKVTDLEASFDEKTLQAKAKDCTNATMDKATKSDNAADPEHLWSGKIVEVLVYKWSETSKPPLNFLKPIDLLQFKWSLSRMLWNFCLVVWKQNVQWDFTKWFHLHGKLRPNAREIKWDGRRACAKADGCSWWNWDKGSSLFFWTWPHDYQETAQIGLKPMFNGPAPSNADQQPPYSDPSIKALPVKEKLSVVVDKGYIELADIKFVEAMMFMFHIPKGETDVHIIYNDTKSGLNNNALYAPWFALPTVNFMLQWVTMGTWLADNNYGKQFLNLLLHPNLRKYCGVVDLSQLLASASDEPSMTGVWIHNALGLKPSPYNSVQRSLQAKQINHGSPNSRADRLHAAEITWYVDGVRIMAPTEDLAWKCSSKMAKGLCWLGLQDAACKQRIPSQELGTCAGATVSTNNRWLQDQIQCIALQINVHEKHTNAGYLNLEAKSKNDGTVPLTQQDRTIPPEGDLPTWVSAVSQFEAGVNTLLELSYMEDSPMIPARVCNKEAWCYVVGDALGLGSGSSTWKSKERKIHVELSTWSEKVSNGSSSNFREAANLVESLKCKVASAVIARGLEVFVFTDNFVAESTIYKGSSSSKLLHNMILEL